MAGPAGLARQIPANRFANSCIPSSMLSMILGEMSS